MKDAHRRKVELRRVASCFLARIADLRQPGMLRFAEKMTVES
jgi:hypothetical protein